MTRELWFALHDRANKWFKMYKPAEFGKLDNRKCFSERTVKIGYMEGYSDCLEEKLGLHLIKRVSIIGGITGGIVGTVIIRIVMKLWA